MLGSGVLRRGMIFVLAAPLLPAQAMLAAPTTRDWANRTFQASLPAKERGQAPTVPKVLDLLRRGETRAALTLLALRPPQEWAEEALRASRDPLVPLALHRLGYRRGGADPFSYLGDGWNLQRPWTAGLGLHLEPGDAWRVQWVPHPALLPKIEAPQALPPALEQAPQPSALIHVRQLRAGLQRLKDLAGGEGGLGATLIHGRRAGFLLRHVDAWLRQPAPGLAPLADREAWILHYGLEGRGLPTGTLVFLPGGLPARTELALGLLRLNPLANGPRSRSHTLSRGEASVQVTQVKGAGGVLHLLTRPEGTWLCDREGPLRALALPEGESQMAERTEWAKVALAGRGPQTQVSLWTLPRQGADADFERVALRRRSQNAAQGHWPNPFVAKAAPRSLAWSIALGAGPTESMLKSLLRQDDPYVIEDPKLPEFMTEGQPLSPAQRKAFEAAQVQAKQRRAQQQAIRQQLFSLQALLDLRGAALSGGGFVAPPPLTEGQKATLARYQRLRREDRSEAWKMRRDGQLDFYGPSGEPGMTPALALALPIQEGREGAVSALMGQVWPQLFKGTVQKKSLGTVEVRRVRTNQAFAPCYAVVQKHLVVATDEGPLAAVVAGLQGQAPTLADLPSQAYGRLSLDGTRAAADLQQLLVAYLRSHRGWQGPWQWLEGPATADEAAAEVASTFGPFLGAIRSLGARTLEATWTPGGLELRPR